MNIRPENQAYLWPSLAQSRQSERSANGPVDLCSKRSPLGVARSACFEQLAGIFASCGALDYAKIFASLKIKNGISLTPLNCALNAFTFALNDSADDWLNDYQSSSGWSDSYSWMSELPFWSTSVSLSRPCSATMPSNAAFTDSSGSKWLKSDRAVIQNCRFWWFLIQLGRVCGKSRLSCLQAQPEGLHIPWFCLLNTLIR